MDEPTILRRRAAVAALGLTLSVLLGACSAATPVSDITGTPAAASQAPATTDDATPEASDAPAEATPEPTEATPEPTEAAIDPCSLITRDEANALAGVKTLDPMPQGEPPVRCVWPTPLEGPVGQTEIDVGDGAKKAYDIDHDILAHDFKAVPDLGDEAYIEDQKIFFRKGDTWVAITVVRLDSPSKLPQKLVQLAQTVAGRL